MVYLDINETINLETSKCVRSFSSLRRFTKLEKLKVCGNSYFDLKWLSRMSVLRDLSLIHCNMTLENLQFYLLCGPLKDLRLNGNNFKHIGKDTFKELNNLKHLNLDNNQIESIEADSFSCLFGLETLSLAENNTTQVDSSMFAGLCKLQRLKLSANSWNKLILQFDASSSCRHTCL